MTQQETIEYNKRCAEFLGVHLHESMLNMPHSHFTGYHSDWNWIMELIEKIEIKNLVFIDIYGNSSCDIKCAYPEWHEKHRKGLRFTACSDNRKEAVIQAINQFLIWYNEQQRT